jgi:hypothetical protein
MSESPNIVDEYLQQADALIHALGSCPPEAFARRTAPGHWTITEMVSHLADAELIAAVRIRRLITQDRPHLYGYDRETWAQRLGYQRQNIEDAALLFTALRRANGALLGQVAYEDWRCAGQDEERGEISLFQLLEDAIVRTREQLEQVRALAAEFSAQGNGQAGVAPQPAVAAETSAAKFYGLALVAGLTILAVGFFMQSLPVYIFGGILSALGVLLMALTLLNRK